MKTAPKKVFCSVCQKLVKGQEQKTETTTQIICPKCKKTVYIRDGFSWKYLKEPD